MATGHGGGLGTTMQLMSNESIVDLHTIHIKMPSTLLFSATKSNVVAHFQMQIVHRLLTQLKTWLVLTLL